jgi:hypothetical protein
MFVVYFPIYAPPTLGYQVRSVKLGSEICCCVGFIGILYIACMQQT